MIALTKSWHCYRSIREGLPEDLQHQLPDLRALDYSRVRTIQAPLLKVIRGYISKTTRSCGFLIRRSRARLQGAGFVFRDAVRAA